MELIWAAIKFVEYLVLGPVWWVASHLAALVFPFEGDAKHDALAMIFSTIILGLLVWGFTVWIR